MTRRTRSVFWAVQGMILTGLFAVAAWVRDVRARNARERTGGSRPSFAEQWKSDSGEGILTTLLVVAVGAILAAVFYAKASDAQEGVFGLINKVLSL
ncbi:MAG: hypothetical protein IT198_14100 [Acidimicrobiia bacterium]|nr:hypothetical protein [Acidimicrobiia bacterium]